MYDPSIWGPESYYIELGKAQKEEMDRREKERKDKTKVSGAINLFKTFLLHLMYISVFWVMLNYERPELLQLLSVVKNFKTLFLTVIVKMINCSVTTPIK